MGQKNILFICTGNVCRSLMAELLLKRMAADRGLPWQVKSCGIAAETYFQVPPEIQAALSSDEIGPISHTAQLVSRNLLKWSDLTLTMTKAQRKAIIDQFPEFTRKVHVLRSYVGLSNEDVQDPIGQSQAIYTNCRDKIRQALEALIQHDRA